MYRLRIRRYSYGQLYLPVYIIPTLNITPSITLTSVILGSSVAVERMI